MESATMSTSKLTPADLPTPSSPARVATTLHETATSIAATGRTAAFWTATGLPLVYLPLLATGTAAEYPRALGALLALHAVTLLTGHGHDPGT